MIEAVGVSKPFCDGRVDHDAVLAALRTMLRTDEQTEAAFAKLLLNACTAQRQVDLPTLVKKTIPAAAVPDPDAPR